MAGDIDRVLAEALDAITGATGRDFSRYKPATLEAVLRRELVARSAPDYLRMLRARPDVANALADRFLVTVTGFFRDPEVWRELADTVFPGLLERDPARLRIWCIGCASGEEAYSIAILVHEAIERHHRAVPVAIVASDVHGGALQRARAGCYTHHAVGEVGADRLARCFERSGDRFRVVPSIRALVKFANHDVIHDPPFVGVDLIVCRNVLMYFERELQDDVRELFHYALNPGGHLVVGAHDAMIDPRFARRHASSSVYACVEQGPQRMPALRSFPRPCVRTRPPVSAADR